MTPEEFYNEVACLLEADHQFHEPRGYWRRWARNLGNGRFPGHGLVRVHSPDLVHVALYDPPVTGFLTMAETLEKIKRSVNQDVKESPTTHSVTEYSQE